MPRFSIVAAATTAVLLSGPAFAQTANETAEEILNESADTASEVIDATPLGTEEDCMNPTAEQLDSDADTASEEIGCTQDVSGEPAAGEEIFEDLEEADDEGTDG